MSRKTPPQSHHETTPLTWFVLTVGLLLIGWCVWWNAFVYWKKLKMMGELLYRDGYTPAEYRDGATRVMTFHPELREDAIMLYALQGLQKVLAQNQDQAQALEDTRQTLEAWEPLYPDSPRIWIYPGRMYAFLWFAQHQESDYEKAVDYFERALRLSPKYPFALYDLHALYRLHGDLEEAANIREVIERYYGPMTEEQASSII